MRTLTLAAFLPLAGCVTSPVVPLDNNTYLVSMHTGWSLMSRDTLVEKSAIAAQAFCQKSGQDARVKTSTATGIHGLTSQSASVVFTCVAPAAPR